MGITGLLPFLEQAKRPCHISEFRGATVAVDTYCWLHKGATVCPIQLVQGEETREHIDYCLRYVKMLQAFNIRPILVFDGRNLPAKAKTESKRREARSKARQRGAELLRLGKTQEARSYLKQAVNITPEMAAVLINECHKINVDCIVAPYESDAQLAFFSLRGIAEVIITEDSDLVLFGCTKVLYKLDTQGNGVLVETEKIPLAMKIRPDRYTFDKFRHMCILSGCDYVDSLYGIGLKKARKFITLTDETNPEIFLFRIPRYLKMSKIQVTKEYKNNFMMADATFRHQIVFDPFKKKLVPLTDPQECGTNPKYCSNAGETYDNEKAFQVAVGNFHPSTFKRLNSWCPLVISSNSIWSSCYKKTVSRKLQKEQTKAQLKITLNTAPIETDNIEIQMQQEEEIKKELEFYSRVPVIQKEEEELKINESTEDDDPEIISPVLKMNPFIKKRKEESSVKIDLFRKKLSKFPRTTVTTNSIVRSRYFLSDSLTVQNAENDKDSPETDTEISKSNIGTITAIVHQEDMASCDELSIITENEVTESGDTDERQHSLTKIDLIEEIVIIEEQKTNPKSPRSFKQESKVLATPLLSPKVSSNLKRKLETCRMVGLKRPRSQQQITNFFKKT